MWLIDTHTDKIQTDTYTDIRQIILIEMLCDVILWTSTPVLKEEMAVARDDVHSVMHRCHIQTRLHTPDTELDGEI